MSKKESNKAIGRLLWGKNGGNFSLRRLFLNLLKKKIKGEGKK
jgi:hypothetical protein